MEETSAIGSLNSRYLPTVVVAADSPLVEFTFGLRPDGRGLSKNSFVLNTENSIEMARLTSLLQAYLRYVDAYARGDRPTTEGGGSTRTEFLWDADKYIAVFEHRGPLSRVTFNLKVRGGSSPKIDQAQLFPEAIAWVLPQLTEWRNASQTEHESAIHERQLASEAEIVRAKLQVLEAQNASSERLAQFAREQIAETEKRHAQQAIEKISAEELIKKHEIETQAEQLSRVRMQNRIEEYVRSEQGKALVLKIRALSTSLRKIADEDFSETKRVIDACNNLLNQPSADPKSLGRALETKLEALVSYKPSPKVLAARKELEETLNQFARECGYSFSEAAQFVPESAD